MLNVAGALLVLLDVRFSSFLRLIEQLRINPGAFIIR